METKNLEEMTREELVELVYSLNKEIEGLQKDLDVYKGWKNREEDARILAEKKLTAAKAFFEVV
ncbi:hypothetical protein AAH029_01320 [Parabacteroides distasonis]|uniref:hypothetical protein n=1 Tax=Parabacteroides distasonis TaxID=823 RepID=UPI0039B5ABEA